MARALALILLAVAVCGAPAPTFTADEATVADLFAGERIDFTGLYVPKPHPHLLRYAITCCRADAQPVLLPLATPLNARGWVKVHGLVVREGNALFVEPQAVRWIVPPHDPFAYR